MTTQTAFHTALRDAGLPVPKGLLDKAGAPAGKRFAVYRNNVAVSLAEALREGFPATARLLGKDNFTALSRQYVQAHAPDSPLMFLYGGEFPAFLSGVQPLAHLGYLPQVAALEWQMRLAYHAADAAPIAPETLQALPPDGLLAARFVFAPAVRLVRSDHPVGDIRAFALGAGPAPAGGAQAVLITRPEYDPVLTVLPAAQADLIQALLKGAPLGDALDAAPDADLHAALRLILTHNALTATR
ncbi:DNA-binding domain-containing protein [Thalassovita sp.]|uniref:DNA-binding domain-containing protein n=1 Tax=Thalassovita sp. TaxID=1979401 RepID=UPI0029DE6EF4|nr:DNA-binding domain-containing protein [Thalassovita sp.]